MLPTPDDFTVTTSWTNGQKAVVDLMTNRAGKKIIKKVYRPGYTSAMFREYMVAKYVASRLAIVPQVLGFRPLQKELYFSYVSGQRVLEWVMQRFGDDVNLSRYQSFHGLNPPDYVDPEVAKAFARFRESMSDEARRLKDAISNSYASLHRIGILHGSADPRNVIYDDNRVIIIDFDNSRPSLNPATLDARSLSYWYGLC
jgi:hypothetical protein